MKILLTGMAGFIGFHLTNKLLNQYTDIKILGLDNINDYYDINLKHARLTQLGFKPQDIDWNEIVSSSANPNVRFVQMNLQDTEGVAELFASENFDYVINLAAQAGVRYSLTNPQSYIDSNVTGFLNILEGCRNHPVKHLIYASSSSVYGLNTKIPFSERDRVDSPASLYAATKKMNEAMAHTYAHLFGVKSSGLRFFTVYGEWGRPDMALFIFTEKISAGKPVQLFNYGKMQRDFTYVDDIVTGITDLLEKVPDATPPCTVFNIGNNSPVELNAYVDAIEEAVGKKAVREFLPMQPGDVPATYADVDHLMNVTNFKPSTDICVGIKKFIAWYKEYYSLV
ncbi:NAD-dependent epimerase/dehydratase family protein [Ruminococcaceae bacterium OttesenSCG-928-A16]|nr:NAD-dependent epimerase/dehydratase family protein [Ruminococcaceae bacterium OttesenSCG-928-A16]